MNRAKPAFRGLGLEVEECAILWAGDIFAEQLLEHDAKVGVLFSVFQSQSARDDFAAGVFLAFSRPNLSAFLLDTRLEPFLLFAEIIKLLFWCSAFCHCLCFAGLFP